MFFITLGIYTRWSFIVFSLAQRILLLIFQCHTVTHGTDLRKSPQLWFKTSKSQKLPHFWNPLDVLFPEMEKRNKIAQTQVLNLRNSTKNA